MNFVAVRTAATEEKFKKYNALSDVEKYKYEYRLKQLKDDLWFAFKKITDGRIASMGLYKTLKNPENIPDISVDAVITVFKYINRYDATRCSSAFAFVTQVAYNSIVASLNEINVREDVIVTGLDFIDNLNTIDNPTKAFSATNKLISIDD